MAFNEHIEVFVVHVTFLLMMVIYLARKAQIALLIAKEVKISTKYLDFADVFFKKKASILLKATKLNQHAIKLYKYQQPLYRLIYSLGLVKFKTLKTYFKTNLTNGFIWPSKSSVGAFIFFVGKTNGNFRLYVDYWGLNDLTIKNWYTLFLISKLLDQLSQVKRFTQLDFISAYYQMRIKESNK